MIRSFVYKLHLRYLLRKDPSGTLYYRRKYKGVCIGNNCSFIGRNISFSSEPYLVKIGDNVRVSFEVSFVTHDGGTFVLRSEESELCVYGPIIIGNNVFIGARSIIMPYVNIGNNVIVCAGSIVTKSIPENEVWAGVPAKRICTIEEYKNKNFDKFSYILNKKYDEKKEILEKCFKEYLSK